MRGIASLGGFCGAALVVASLSPSAAAFSYAPWVDGPARTLAL